MITPDEFDTMVRDTLRAVDAQTQPDAGTADRLIANAREGTTKVVPLRRRPTWIAPLIAAAAVVVVALALVLVNNREGSKPVQPGSQLPTPNGPTTSRPISHAPTSSAPTTPAPTSSAPTTAAPTIPGLRTSAVSYLDAQHGWALGDAKCPTGTRSNCATVLRTVDGGHSWHPIGVPAGLVSTRNFGACGDNGTVTGPCVDQIVFASAKIGYLWSYRKMFMTIDGGTHWSDLNTPQVVEVAVVGNTAVRLTTRQACSDGCQYGVFAAPIGTPNWTTAIPYSTDRAGDWQLAGGSGVGYVLKAVDTQAAPPADQALYRSTDGRHWTQVKGAWPCGKTDIATIKVDLNGALAVTCV